MSHRDRCFSYAVSNDGVVVSHPRDIMQYESVGEEESESSSEALVQDEGTSEDQSQGDSQVVVEDEGTGEDERGGQSQALVKYEGIQATTSEQKIPCPLFQRRGRSLSRLRLPLSTSSVSTLVNLSSASTDENSIADSPRSEPGDYEFITEIAIDGEGIVDLMRARSTRQLVVRKTVEYARSAYAKPIEAAVLQDILPDRHPNIINLLAFEPYDLDGARYYFEYCPGGDLHRLVNRYRAHGAFLPEPFIWHVYEQLLSALAFLHRGFDPRCPDRDRKGICHRDLKPTNVFLRPDAAGSVYPDVVLADFGHATLDFATYEPAGTTFWQPPELPRHSPKGDVYSLGAIIHFLIHFEAPVASLPSRMNDASEGVRAAWRAAPEARRPILEFVDGYSEDLVCVMLMALEADENKRRNAGRLLEFLCACVERRFPDGSMRGEEPLAPWAFELVLERGEEGETGSDQYFGMMDWCGYGGEMERSRSLPLPPSSTSVSFADLSRGV